VSRLNTRSKFRREVLTSSVTSIGIYALGLVTGPIIAHALGPTGRGELAAVIVPSAVLVWILAFGMPLAASYHLGERSESEVLWTATLFGLLVGGPLALVLWFVGPAYLSGHSDTTLLWARIFVVSLPFSVGIQAALEVLRRRSAGPAWNAWRSAPFAVTAVGLVALAVSGRLTLGSAFAVSFAGSVSPAVLLVRRLWTSRPPRPSWSTFRLMLPYAWRTATASSANSLTARLDQVVLAGAVAPAQLGLYAVAVTASSASNPLTAGISLALFGNLREDAEAGRRTARFRRSVAATAVVSCATALAIGAVAPLLLRVAFGSGFAAAATPLRVLLVGQVALDLVSAVSTGLYAEGRPGDASRAAVLGGVVTVVGLVALVPRWGITGAAAVTTMANVGQLAYLAVRLRSARWSPTAASTTSSSPSTTDEVASQRSAEVRALAATSAGAARTEPTTPTIAADTASGV
jgi:O-antigen/teichoic acid export membrane protein